MLVERGGAWLYWYQGGSSDFREVDFQTSSMMLSRFWKPSLRRNRSAKFIYRSVIEPPKYLNIFIAPFQYGSRVSRCLENPASSASCFSEVAVYGLTWV